MRHPPGGRVSLNVAGTACLLLHRCTGNLAWLSVGLAVCFWLFDSLLDWLLFEGSGFFRGLLPDDPKELWMRLLVVSLFVCFGFIAQYLATARRRSESRLRLSAAVFESADDGIIITDKDYRIVDVNRSFERITGTSRDTVIGTQPGLLQSEQHGEDFYRELRAALAATGSWEGEVWDRHLDGGRYPLWVSISSVRNEADQLSNYIVLFRDMSNLKEVEQRLTYLAHYDALTGLANRTLMDELLQKALRHAKRNNREVVLVFLDLDHFKDINDTLGHAVGDRVLVEAAQRLRLCVRDSDTVARLGGDEFVLMFEHLSNEDEINVIADKLRASFNNHFDVDGHELFLTTSVGITVYPRDGVNAGELLKNADMAMYHAKARGRNNYQFYSRSLNQASRQRLSMVSELRRAMEAEQFTLHYQPRFYTESAALAGLEAILCWQHPHQGLISATQFMPLIEKSGLTDAVGEWLLWEVCRQFRGWREAGFTLPGLTVKLPAPCHRQQGLAGKVEHILRETGAGPENLELEMAETLLLHRDHAILDQMAALHDSGVTFTLADFGTGYSPINQLRGFPINRVKVNRDFTGGINDPNDEAIITALVSIAHDLGIEVIAEGVDSARQLEFLRQQQCDLVQGACFSNPRSPEDLDAWLCEAGHWTRAGGMVRASAERRG
jgi:diguanylate cyclase (GGDEF)-like protein/PAS domain S-box-containing protein